jgi:hypothetical protein
MIDKAIKHQKIVEKSAVFQVKLQASDGYVTGYEGTKLPIMVFVGTLAAT